MCKVFPSILNGATKLTSDKLFIAANNYKGWNDIKFSVVRYGNVMGSRGSVIPLFINQIKQGKDITITNPNMTRFIMTLANAVELVKHAFLKGGQGEILVQKSPLVSLNLLDYLRINHSLILMRHMGSLAWDY